MKTNYLAQIAGVSVIVLGTAFGTPAAAECDWKPTRAVTYIVPWGAGGGTDANSRMLAKLLSDEFGVPFNVVNRTGGNGVTGHSAIARAKPDGYTVGAVTTEIVTMHWIGLTDLTYTDITPIALVDIVSTGVVARTNSPFNSIPQVLEYAKAHPGELTASGSAQGAMWHLALAGLLNAEGLDPNLIRWIPSSGAAEGLKELMAGGVDIAAVAQSEAKNLIEQGEIKGLGYMNATRMPALPNIPTTVEQLASGWTFSSFISLSGPRGLDHEIACSYEKVAEQAMQTKEWADFKASRVADVVVGGSDKMAQIMAKSDVALGATIKAIGLKK